LKELGRDTTKVDEQCKVDTYWGCDPRPLQKSSLLMKDDETILREIKAEFKASKR
jgi:hypothetical protein